MKKASKVISLVLAVVMVLSALAALAACGKKDGDKKDEKLKVGFIFLHDESSTYDKNFIDAAKAVCEKLGVEAILKTGIDEKAVCTDTCDDLVDQGCKIIFADSFGHEAYMIEAARKHTDVQFCHATGVRAHTEGLANYHNAFASIYEGRYLAGVAAGMKLNELKEAGKLKGEVPKVGYVGAYTYAEVMSGYTSFFLGIRSVCPDAEMDVTFTGTWYDEGLEKAAAEKLIAGGCDLLSQHADSWGAPTACEKAGIPNVSYNGSTVDRCANTFIVSSKINWEPYFEFAIQKVLDGKGNEIPADWTGDIASGSVELSAINEKAAAAGTQAKLDEVKKALQDGTVHVFDINTFTVNGAKLDKYDADVDYDDDKSYKHETQVIKDGYFSESTFRSAPYFDVEIDGITLLDRNYGESDS